MTTVLHVAPHPDDESIGAPCTLLHLSAAGARVVVVACGLGRPADEERRRDELLAATRAGGFEVVVRDPPTSLAADDDLNEAQRTLTPWLSELLADYDVDVVISPHLHDAHPAHEAVARAVRDAAEQARRPPVWWSWSIWADLRAPTLLFPCTEDLVGRAVGMLGKYGGELARNNYVDMLRAAGRLAAIRGVERVRGFGASALPGVQHAELLTELGWVEDCWRFGVPRVASDLALPMSWGADASQYIHT